MKKIYSDIIEFRGSHYEFGKMQGDSLKDSLTIRNRKKQSKIRRPRFSIDIEETKQVILAFAPGIWEELLGLKDSLKWSIEDVVQEFGGYQVEYKPSGCSIYANKTYFIRNYDFHPKTYEGRYTLFSPDDVGYALIGPSQRITGRMDGMNEKGLVLGYNFMHRKNPKAGFICCMIGRIILESCSNVEEAIHMLKEIPHRHSFGYVVLDESEETYVIEATPRGVEVRKSNICTNHFERMKHENRKILGDSYARLDVIKQQEKERLDAKQAFQLLNDPDKGVFSNQYRNWAGTIHTSAYFPKEKEAWFSLGGNQTPTVFNFNEWLSGANVKEKRITGELDTEMGFLHMDENVR